MIATGTAILYFYTFIKHVKHETVNISKISRYNSKSFAFSILWWINTKNPFNAAYHAIYALQNVRFCDTEIF